MDNLTLAQEKFSALLLDQLRRVETLKADKDFLDFSSVDRIVIGVIAGDGIGPAVTAQAARVLEYLLTPAIRSGKVEIRQIEGLTIENRAAMGKTIPDNVLAELKKCHVILKGPTTTPEAGDPWPMLESANVAMRKELDLFANVRPVKAPEQGIDWIFFRENTEGAYAVGSQGFHVDEDLAVDFTITTTAGTERIVRAAFEYAKNNGKTKVTAVTKANVIKTTDGKFLDIAREIAKEYPGITLDEWYIDIMTAKLIDEKRRREFQVFVLPNLYGDILTDEAAELQGGVGTAGAANNGKRCAMFEAIGGSGLRMVKEGRVQYANPASVMRGAVMLLSHIGYQKEADAFAAALDICTGPDSKLNMTGREGGSTSAQFADYVMEMIEDGRG